MRYTGETDRVAGERGRGDRKREEKEREKDWVIEKDREGKKRLSF